VEIQRESGIQSFAAWPGSEHNADPATRRESRYPRNADLSAVGTILPSICLAWPLWSSTIDPLPPAPGELQLAAGTDFPLAGKRQ
jgi:hypothetical protein